MVGNRAFFSHGWRLASPSGVGVGASFLRSVARPSQSDGAPLLLGMSICLVEWKRLRHRCCRAPAMLQETTRESTSPLVDHNQSSIQRSSFALALVSLSSAGMSSLVARNFVFLRCSTLRRTQSTGRARHWHEQHDQLAPNHHRGEVHPDTAITDGDLHNPFDIVTRNGPSESLSLGSPHYLLKETTIQLNFLTFFLTMTRRAGADTQSDKFIRVCGHGGNAIRFASRFWASPRTRSKPCRSGLIEGLFGDGQTKNSVLSRVLWCLETRRPSK